MTFHDFRGREDDDDDRWVTFAVTLADATLSVCSSVTRAGCDLSASAALCTPRTTTAETDTIYLFLFFIYLSGNPQITSSTEY